MNKLFILLLLGMFSTIINASEDSYYFPTLGKEYSKYEATVVGTLPEVRADLPKANPLHGQRITIFPDREIPPAFFFDDQLSYSAAWQDDAAPLVFLIAGTGASHNGAKNIDMARAYYHAGFHVISLSSPTYMNFIVSASKSGIPGHAYDDAKDLYHVMELIWQEVKNDIEVVDFYIAGYSLGGFNTAFVSKLDEQRQVFKFRKALLINPPVSLYNSISLLDRMSQNIPGGPDNFNKFFDSLLQEIGQEYKKSQGVEMDSEFLYQAYKAVNPNDEELAALIGVSFRIASANLFYTSDVLNRAGFIVPKNITMALNSSPEKLAIVAHHLGFTDYYHSYFYPYYKEQYPDLNREEFTELLSLVSLESYLQNSSKIEVIHNVDDIILEPGEIDFFSRVFAERAKIYPKGGHCGNMAHRDNVAHMIKVFQQ